MQSIFSTQDERESTLAQAIKAHKESKQNKAVQFANINFMTFIKQAQKIISRAAIVSNLQAIQQDSSPKAFAKRDIFASNFKAEAWQELKTLNANADEKALNELKEFAKSYEGVKVEFKQAEQFLLNLMQSVLDELKEHSVESEVFREFWENYSEQIATREELKGQIIDAANDYIVETNPLREERLYESIVSKLQSYHQALQTGKLDSFFAPLVQYLEPHIQSELAKALHSIYDELETPTAFELAGGNKLFWKVDENKIRFKILSKEQLKAFYEQRQEAKFCKEFLEQMRQNERDLSGKFENLELFLANFDANSSNAKLNSSAFDEKFSLFDIRAEMLKGKNSPNAQANANAKSLLQGLLGES